MTTEELTCEQRIDDCLYDIADIMTMYMEDGDLFEEGNEHYPPFHEYGLSFDYVEPNTFNHQPVGYYRYQFSWGGPSDELRFHPDGSITYHFMDWFDGAKRYVTNKPWAKWLREYFTDINAINWGDVTIYDYSECEEDEE